MSSLSPRLVLASSSPARRSLLERLGLAFEVVVPAIDETPLPHETPIKLVQRLAEAKARAVAEKFAGSDALIIASDQVAVLNDAICGKPGDHEHAFAQLRSASGHVMEFLTSLCLLNCASGQLQSDVVPYEVWFRDLSDTQIENYLRREQPYACAGAFKSEQLGVALFEKQRGDDPTSLIGLPLISLVRMLEREDVFVI